MDFTRALGLILAVALLSPSLPGQPTAFDTWFQPATLRVDYHHGGTATTEFFAVDALREESGWAGPRKNLLTPFNRGKYQVRVHDAKTDRLLYSRGYATVFGEWQTLPEARKRQRVFHESVLVPYPRRPVQIVFCVRDGRMFREKHRHEVDPAAPTVRRDPPRRDVTRIPVLKNGPPAAKVDLVVVSEGYPKDQCDRFEADARKRIQAFFARRPFRDRRDDFNVTLVFAPSDEAGIDEPTMGRFRRTAAEASFYSFRLPRYVLVEDMTRLRDLVAGVPYDGLIVLVNSERYGGGGIFNWFLVVTANNPWADYVIVHEFGHAFAGLADEYYSSNVTYEDFYPGATEPIAPNITRFLGAPDRIRLKWNDLVEPRIALPTPWPQAKYDALVAAQKECVREAKSQGQSEEAVHELVQKLNRKRQAFLAKVPHHGQVGAFEGGGYVARGMYRPSLDCVMFSKSSGPFCPVCRRELSRMIDFLTDR